MFDWVPDVNKKAIPGLVRQMTSPGRVQAQQAAALMQHPNSPMSLYAIANKGNPELRERFWDDPRTNFA